MKPVYVVATKSYWQGSSWNYAFSTTDKKEAQDKANELHDTDIKSGEQAKVFSKTEWNTKICNHGLPLYRRSFNDLGVEIDCV